MALWFRSQIIVIMNALLFLGIWLAYITLQGPVDSINVSFALVSLVTARILNWQKEKLEIKTEILRNFYLVLGFVMTLIALYQIVPEQYVTLSWTGAALLFFVLSFVLKNVKYRYMAIAAMIATAFYLFLFDLARIDVVYRVIAFLFLAIISIGVSFYYAKRIKKKTNE